MHDFESGTLIILTLFIDDGAYIEYTFFLYFLTRPLNIIYSNAQHWALPHAVLLKRFRLLQIIYIAKHPFPRYDRNSRRLTIFYFGTQTTFARIWKKKIFPTFSSTKFIIYAMRDVQPRHKSNENLVCNSTQKKLYIKHLHFEVDIYIWKTLFFSAPPSFFFSCVRNFGFLASPPFIHLVLFPFDFFVCENCCVFRSHQIGRILCIARKLSLETRMRIQNGDQ